MEKNLIKFGESHNAFNRIVLSKESSIEQIRTYFEGVLKLYQSNEEYPVNLDDVWPLVYVRKDVAVGALKKSFQEGIDYITKPIENQSLHQNMEQNRGGQNKIDYFLTTSCLEYFIARKVRSVFDVYRQVFKKVATGEVRVVQSQPKTGAEMLLMYAQQMVEQEKRVNLLEKRIDDIEQRTATEIPYSTIVGYATRYGIRVSLNESSALGRSASAKCRDYGFRIDKVNDPRFGTVGSYPDGVLAEVFEKYYPNVNFK